MASKSLEKLTKSHSESLIIENPKFGDTKDK